MSQMKTRSIAEAPKRQVKAHSAGAVSAPDKLGIVESFVRRPACSMPLTTSLLIGALTDGLSICEVEELRRSLGMPMEKLLPILGISKATFHRRKKTGSLDLSESDRVVRYARLLGAAVEVMESIGNARLWLTSPQVGLGGAVPLEYAETEVGAREVESLLGRIEHGVY